MRKSFIRAFAVSCAATTAMLVAVAGASAQTTAPSAPAPNGFAGVWLDDTGEGAIEIAQCAQQRLCGRIVWLKKPNDTTGKPLTDGYNPEATKRRRPICGLPVIGDLKQQPGGSWDEGWIYDPKVGKSYDVELKLRGADRLQVTGYLGTKFLSESFIWTRAPASLARCTTTSASVR